MQNQDELLLDEIPDEIGVEAAPLQPQAQLSDDDIIDQIDDEIVLDEIPDTISDSNFVSDLAPVKRFEEEGGSGLADMVLDAGLVAGKAILKPVMGVLEGSDRLLGTTLAYSADGYKGIFSDKRFGPLQQAEQREREAGANGWKTLPVSFSQDLVQKPVVKAMTDLGQGLQSYAKENPEDIFSEDVEAIGKVTEGIAGGTGIAAAIVGSYFLDPIGTIRILNLTKKGSDLAKVGKTAKGTAQQVLQGERNLIGLEMGGKQYPLLPKKLTDKMMLEGQEAAAIFDMSRPGQYLRHFTTRSSLPAVSTAVEEFAIVDNIISAEKQVLNDAFKTKATTLGLDITKPEVLDDFYKWADNPSTYKPKVANVETYRDLVGGMDAELAKVVEEARSAGVPIKEFKGTAFQGPAYPEIVKESEKYVPRYARPGKVQELKARKIIGDAEEAEAFVENLFKDGVPSGPQFSKQALRKRNLLNRDEMNKVIFEKTGVEDYFSDDIFAAYADKIAEVKRLTELEKLKKAILPQAALSSDDWIRVKNDALKRVKEAKALGLAPNPNDIRLSKINLRTLRPVDEVARGKLGVDRNSGLYLPKSDADLLESIFIKPDQNAVIGLMNSTMRAWKQAAFFNPGFLARNAWENYGRAVSANLNPKEISEGLGAYVFKKGNTKYLKEFEAMEGAHIGMLGMADGASTAKTIKVPKEVADLNNANDTLVGTLHEMSAKGKLTDFLKGIRKVPDAIADNPAFRKFQSVNAAGESSFRFAYYNKLRKQGWDSKEAFKEVNKKFISYQITRNKIISGQTAFPFLNYAMKNAETSLRLLAQNPRGAVVFGPNGAIERAISEWAGWQPGQTKRLKEMFGSWHSDMFMGHILPNEDIMMREKDYIKQLMNSWFNADGSMTGYQMWAKLPSNYHGLSMLNPLEANELAGPMVQMGISLMGIDPFTGMPIKGGNQEDVKKTERLKNAFKQFSGSFIPSNLVGAAREYAEQKWPDYEKNLLNLGMSEEAINTLMGGKDKADNLRKAQRRQLSVVKSLWVGRATQLDIDIYFRIMADMKETQKSMQALMNQAARGGDDKKLDQTINRAQRVYEQMMKRSEKLMNMKDEYDAKLKEMGAEPLENVEYTEDEVNSQAEMNKLMGIVPGPEDDDIDLEAEEMDVDDAILDSIPTSGIRNELNRSPATTSGYRINQTGEIDVMVDGQPNEGLSNIWTDWLSQESKGKLPQDRPVLNKEQLDAISDEIMRQNENIRRDIELYHFGPNPNAPIQWSQARNEPSRMPAEAAMKTPGQEEMGGGLPSGVGTAGAAALIGSAMSQRTGLEDLSEQELMALPYSKEKEMEVDRRLSERESARKNPKKKTEFDQYPRGQKARLEFMKQLADMPIDELIKVPFTDLVEEELARRERVRKYEGRSPQSYGLVEEYGDAPDYEEPGPSRDDMNDQDNRYQRWKSEGMPIDTDYFRGNDIEVFMDRLKKEMEAASKNKRRKK